MSADRNSTFLSQSRGFTLVEVLVAVCIVGVLSGAIGAGIVAGVNVWDRARTEALLATDVFPRLAVVENDVANMVQFSELPFAGAPDSIVFPLLVSTGEGLDGPSLCGVSYRYDRVRGILRRKIWGMPGQEPEEGATEAVFTGIDSCTFEYYGLSGAEYMWKQATTNTPLAVKFTIFPAALGTSLERVMPVPAARR